MADAAITIAGVKFSAIKALHETGIQLFCSEGASKAAQQHNITLRVSDSAVTAANELQRGGPGNAVLIVYPANTGELQQVTQILNETGEHAVIQGGNTGLSEAGKADGIVINTTRMNRIYGLILESGQEISLDPPSSEFRHRDGQIEYWREQLLQKVEALKLDRGQLRNAEIHADGGVSIKEVNEVLRYLKLRIPIVMDSAQAATMGACAGNGTGGECAGRYRTADTYTTQGEAVSGAGVIIRFSNPGRHTPTEEEPGIRADGFAYGDSPLGSQGVFSIITNLRMKTSFVPQQVHTALLPIQDWETLLHIFKEAEKAFPESQGEGLESYELISRDALRNVQHVMKDSFPVQERDQLGDAPFYVMLTVTSEHEGDSLLERYSDFLTKIAGPKGSAPLFPEHKGIMYDAENTRVPLIRSKVSTSNTAVLNERKQGTATYTAVTPDMAVSLKYAPKFLGALQELIHEMFEGKQIFQPIFGHIMAKIAMHLHIQGEMGNKRGEFLKRVGDLIVSLKGTRWAEHGVGIEGAGEWLRLTPREIVDKHFAIKIQNDPNNILNPKSFGMDRLFAELGQSHRRQHYMLKLCEGMKLTNAAMWIKEKYPDAARSNAVNLILDARDNMVRGLRSNFARG